MGNKTPSQFHAGKQRDGYVPSTIRKHVKTTSRGGSGKSCTLAPSGKTLALGNITPGLFACEFLEFMISWRLLMVEFIREERSMQGLFSTVSRRNLAA
jgi:hypothetical protein